MNEFRMPFGLYKGDRLQDVEMKYLAWLTPQIKPGALRRALLAELQRRGETVEADPPPAEPVCPGCGGREMRYTWQTDSIGRRHIRRSCAACGRRCGFAEVARFAEQANAAEKDVTS
jgi:uncharacterized protein (DUF3820 family)